MTPLNRLLASRTVSTFGDAMIPLTASFGILHLGGGTAGVSLVLGTTMACTLLVPFGGVIADRMSRARLILIGDVVLCAIQAVTGLLLLAGIATIPVVLGLTAAYGIVNAIVAPALTALIGELTPLEGLRKTNARFNISRNSVRLLGPGAAGLLVATVGPGAAYCLDAATFAVSVVLMVGVVGAASDRRAPERASAAALVRELVTGWREMRQHLWYRDTLVLFSVWNLGFQPVFVLGPVLYATEAGKWATVGTCAAVGAVVGGVLAHRFLSRRILHWPNVLIGAAALEAVALAIGAPVAAVAAGALVAGVVVTVYDTAWDTAIQAFVPQDVMARIDSYTWLIGMGTVPLGMLLTAPAVEAVGVTATLWTGIVLMLGSSAVLVALPRLRTLTLPDEPLRPEDRSSAPQTEAPA
ncbi:MAG: MFS transporter [Actinoplanes sp.]